MTVLNRDDLRAIVVPTVTQTLAYLLAAMIILIGANADTLLQPLAPYIPTAAIRDGLGGVLHAVSQLAGANLAVLVLFWGLIGLTVYGISWAVFNAFIHSYNEAVIETQFTNRGSWLERLSPGLLQLFFGAAAVGFTLASGWVIALLVQNFAAGLLNWSPAALPAEILQTLILALDLYAWAALLRLAFYVE